MRDTSSGKSSVLSAISQIEFPSNDKLTTRCPMRLRMERKEKSSSKVYIKWHADSTYKNKSTFDLIEIEDQNDLPSAIHKA